MIRFHSLLLFVAFGQVFLPLAAPCPTVAQNLEQPLSPTEARAIIEQEMKAKEEARKEKLRKLQARQVTESWQSTAGDHKAILNRVIPPIPKTPALPLTSTAISTLASDSPENIPTPLIPHKVIALSGTIYDDWLTELRWTHEGTPCHAFSNLNFKYLRSVAQLQTATCTYTLIMFLDEQTSESLRSDPAFAERKPEPLPTPSDFSSPSPEYLVVSTNDHAPEEDAFVGIDALHRYYLEHEEELKIAHQRAEALREAREEYLRENPPPPRDTITNYWKK